MYINFKEGDCCHSEEFRKVAGLKEENVQNVKFLQKRAIIESTGYNVCNA